MIPRGKISTIDHKAFTRYLSPTFLMPPSCPFPELWCTLSSNLHYFKKCNVCFSRPYLHVWHFSYYTSLAIWFSWFLFLLNCTKINDLHGRQMNHSVFTICQHVKILLHLRRPTTPLYDLCTVPFSYTLFSTNPHSLSSFMLSNRKRGIKISIHPQGPCHYLNISKTSTISLTYPI